MAANDFPEPIVLTGDEAARVAASFIRLATKALDDNDAEHASVWLDCALYWLPAGNGEGAQVLT